MCVFYAGYCYYPYFLQNNILITFSIIWLCSFSVPGNHSSHCRRTLSAGKWETESYRLLATLNLFFHFKTCGYQTIQCPARKSNNKALQHGFFPGRVERKEAVHHTYKGNSLHFFASTVFWTITSAALNRIYRMMIWLPWPG